MIEHLVYKIKLGYYAPEQILLRQFFRDDERFLFISGDGLLMIYKNVTTMKRVLLAQISKGHLIGDISLIFNSVPLESVTCKSYCNLAMITEEDATYTMKLFPNVKVEIISRVIENPYDPERDYFVKLVKKRIPYFTKMPDRFLKKVYYRSLQ